jgi:hypothetical protein
MCATLVSTPARPGNRPIDTGHGYFGEADAHVDGSQGNFERRREPRQAIAGRDALLDGEPCAIRDMSDSAMRMARPARFRAHAAAHDIMMIVWTAGRRLVFRLTGQVVRLTERDVVLRQRRPHD